MFAWAGYRATNHFFKQRSIRRIDPPKPRTGLMIKWAMRGRRAAGRGLAATNRSSGAAGNDGRQVWGHRIVGACPLQNKQVAKSLEEPARNVSLLSRSPGRALLALVARAASHPPEHQRRELPPCPASSRPAWPPHLLPATRPNRCWHSSHDPTPQRPPPHLQPTTTARKYVFNKVAGGSAFVNCRRSLDKGRPAIELHTITKTQPETGKHKRCTIPPDTEL